MDRTQHIMVVDSGSDTPSNLGFLLKLAGFRISEFNDELEACNWLMQQDWQQNRADMLLLNNPQGQRTLYALLFQIRQRIPALEFLFVAPHPLELTGQIRQIDPPIRQCCATEVHSLTRQLFHNHTNRQRSQAQTNPADSCRTKQNLPQAGTEE